LLHIQAGAKHALQLQVIFLSFFTHKRKQARCGFLFRLKNEITSHLFEGFAITVAAGGDNHGDQQSKD
jgi:hypothetical protein